MTETETAGGIILGSDNKVVVVSQHGNSWSLPKGKIEDNESEEEAARREIEEESGISELQLIKKLGSYVRHRIGPGGKGDAPEKKKITLFLFTTAQTILQPTDPHNPEARWVELDDVPGFLTHQKDKDFVLSVNDEVKEFISQRT